MKLFNDIFIIFSIIAFIYYGFSLFVSNRLKNEFKRFNLEKFRVLVASLQLMGSLGLIFGMKYSFLTTISSLGIAILMLLGFIVRLRIKDSVMQCVPALFFTCINFYIFFYSLY